jgi:photosystem II stability/assembly factor-like uncharacterized protein
MKIILRIIVLILFITTSSYAQWKEINDGLYGGDISSISKNKNGDLLISTYGGGIFISTDNGNNWSSRNDSLYRLITTDIFTNNDTLIANTSSNIFSYSFDNGIKWKNITTSFDNSIILSFCRDSKFYAITRSEFAVSNDLGSNWMKKGPVMIGVNIHKAIYQNETFYLLTELGIYKSSDFGDSWILQPFDQVINNVGFFKIIDSNIFYSDINKLFFSKDLGETWESKQFGQYQLTNFEDFDSFYLISSIEGNFKFFKNSDNTEKILSLYYYQNIRKSLLIDSLYFFCTSQGLYSTNKNITQWNNNKNKGINAINISYIFSDKEDLFIKCNSGEIFKKNRISSTWSKMDLDTMLSLRSIVTFENRRYFIANKRLVVKDTLGNYIESIHFNDDYITDLLLKNKILFAVTFNGKLYKSQNNGISWSQDISFLDSNQRISRIGLINNNIFVGNSINKFYYTSYDNGISWVRDTTLNTLYFFLNIHTNIFDENFYATIGNDYVSVLISKDFGKSWETKYIKNKIHYPGINSIYGTKNFIIAATNNGIFLSYDQGEIWLEISDGLKNFDTREIMAVGDDIYLGTSNGMYTAKLSDFGLSDIDEPKTEAQNYLYAFPAYPVPSNSGFVKALIYWDTTLDIDKAKITITNVTGELINTNHKLSIEKNNNFNGNLIWDCRNMLSGAYFIKIEHGSASVTLKVMVD